MMLPVPLLGLVASFLLPAAVRGSALTTGISANERLCFYADADKAGEKIGVSLHFSCLGFPLTFVLDPSVSCRGLRMKRSMTGTLPFNASFSSASSVLLRRPIWSIF